MTEPAHATLSPSGAERWSTCPASVQLEAGYPDTSSDYADEGTAAHAVAEMALREGKDAMAYKGRRIPMRAGKTVEVTADMATEVQKYVDYVRDVSAGHELLLEQRLDISRWVPEAFGTSDAVILRTDDELHVCDLKFGRGVKVDAEENKQMILYALGALDQFAVVLDFDRVRMTIHQPRLNHVSEWAITADELRERGALLKAAADRAYLYVDSETPPMPSDYAPSEKACRFCKAHAACPAKATEVVVTVSRNVKATPDDFDVIAPQGDMAAPDLGVLMSRVDEVEAWCKAVRAETERRLLLGEPVDGWKLVQGRAGARKWTSEQDAEELLKAMRLKSDEMYDKKVISPTSAEKLLKDTPRRWAKAQALITKSEGSPSVAPASDKRPALVIKPAVDDFDDVTAGADAAVTAGADLV
ncbi:hypothetical protein LMG26854_03343 [Achromobacter aegrifaciens]|uniref:DUF2800 domain-containing protein n=1 Tax=Achromobacter aegrifaciens TaxID=1287736 RepID=UPI00146803AA|nr:DUF2800 domain-containing protein [Achromobacter aegrifaciens]CAB3858501.1 hypothetical protein LMG26854_03343 [Achromobacter aegrifaciens]